MAEAQSMVIVSTNKDNIDNNKSDMHLTKRITPKLSSKHTVVTGNNSNSGEIDENNRKNSISEDQNDILPGVATSDQDDDFYSISLQTRSGQNSISANNSVTCQRKTRCERSLTCLRQTSPFIVLIAVAVAVYAYVVNLTYETQPRNFSYATFAFIFVIALLSYFIGTRIADITVNKETPLLQEQKQQQFITSEINYR